MLGRHSSVSDEIERCLFVSWRRNLLGVKNKYWNWKFKKKKKKQTNRKEGGRGVMLFY